MSSVGASSSCDAARARLSFCSETLDGPVIGDRRRLDDDGGLGEALQYRFAHLFRRGDLDEFNVRRRMQARYGPRSE